MLDQRTVKGRTMALSAGSPNGYCLVDQEQEHFWRELLQKQLGEHWLNLYYPEQLKREPILPKIRGDGGKAA
jgi:hypothetical protein